MCRPIWSSQAEAAGEWGVGGEGEDRLAASALGNQGESACFSVQGPDSQG